VVGAAAPHRRWHDFPLHARNALTCGGGNVNHHATITDPKQLGALLRVIAGYSGQPTPRLPFRSQSLAGERVLP
jgi:hypothetical protein